MCPLFLPAPSEKQPSTQTQWKTPFWKQFVSVVASGKEESSSRAYYFHAPVKLDAGFCVLEEWVACSS